LLIACFVPSVEATDDDFLKCVLYTTVTYAGHPSKCGIPFDINIDGTSGDQDEGIPMYAPKDGYVEQLSYSGPGEWENTIYWASDDGERLFLAHLKTINETGRVKAGDKIGKLGMAVSDTNNRFLRIRAKIPWMPWKAPSGGFSI
jgi:hypothetical protein